MRARLEPTLELNSFLEGKKKHIKNMGEFRPGADCSQLTSASEPRHFCVCSHKVDAAAANYSLTADWDGGAFRTTVWARASRMTCLQQIALASVGGTRGAAPSAAANQPEVKPLPLADLV